MNDAGDSKRNCLIVTHYFSEHRGGVENIAGKIAEGISRRGWNVQWAASDCDKQDANQQNRIRRFPMSSTNFLEGRAGIPIPLWSPNAILSLWKLLKNATVLHLHDCLYCGNVFAFLFAKLQRKKILITQHIAPVPYPNFFTRMLYRIGDATITHLMLKRADAVVFYSKTTRSYYSKRIRKLPAQHFILNGVDRTVFYPVNTSQKTTLRTKLGVEKDRFTLLFAGRFVEKKGLGLIQRLASFFPEIQWVLAGWGPIVPEQWNLANVRVIRGIRGPALAEYYQSADVFILPSVGEGFPLVVQESLACGTPVLISTQTAKAQLDDQSFVFTVPLVETDGEKENFEAWSARITELKGDQQAIQSVRADAADFAANTWSWEKCSAEYLQALESL